MCGQHPNSIHRLPRIILTIQGMMKEPRLVCLRCSHLEESELGFEPKWPDSRIHGFFFFFLILIWTDIYLFIYFNSYFHTCGFIMKEFLSMFLPWAMLPDILITICQNPGRVGGGSFLDPRKIEGSWKWGQKPWSYCANVPNHILGPFSISTHFFLMLILEGGIISFSPILWLRKWDWLYILLRRAQANLEFKCIFPKGFWATLFSPLFLCSCKWMRLLSQGASSL